MDALFGKVFIDTVFAFSGMEAPLNEYETHEYNPAVRKQVRIATILMG